MADSKKRLIKARKADTKQKVTLSLDSETYKKFQEFCEDRAIMLSKKVELFMKSFLEWQKTGVERRKRK